jgi:hypothetical protein
MEFNLKKEPSKISVQSKIKAPKKRTIRQCASVLNSYGDLIDYGKCTGSRFEFSVDVKRDKINSLVDDLRHVPFLDSNVKFTGASINELPYRTPARVNVLLTFI